MTAKKVLIVEDDELNLKLFSDLLVMRGSEVKAIRDGSHFLDTALKFRPDIVLMDIQLHEMSGFELIKQIKMNDLLCHIPVLAITAFAMKSDEEKILNSGFAAYLPKPVAIERFFEVINRFLNVS